MCFSSILPFVTLVVAVLGHGGVYNYSIGDVWYAGSYPWLLEDDQPKGIQRRWWPDPIQSVHHPYLACNRGNPLAKSHPTQHAPIRAGENNLHPEFADPPKPIQCVGPEYSWVHATGPLIAYMADCNGPCDKFDAEGKEVDQWGSRTDVGSAWGWDQYTLTRTGWGVRIPKNLKPGNYLIRHEIIMIELMPPQFYPECAQLTVIGDGDKVPGEEYLVAFPGAYSMDEPGLAISGDLYSQRGHFTFNYTIPGPPVWTGGN
ncbi:glycoside hydrolase [Corynascus novoguineensis]|uniref:lytic cellulose monooxygenase (C4-dehydrogenating) n=1 Tax=Corynascus novoguineensis TaxID=1126955 RepID=A0AAN7CLB1_9PEZI|nr:glycoside hydrolase [Corynascus novoguineensis]